MKKVICFFICVCFMMQSVAVFAEGNTDLGLNAKSAILMEESTGNILYESNPDEDVKLNDGAYQDKLIEGYVNALERWNNKYNRPKVSQPENNGVM